MERFLHLHKSCSGHFVHLKKVWVDKLATMSYGTIDTYNGLLNKGTYRIFKMCFDSCYCGQVPPVSFWPFVILHKYVHLIEVCRS